MNSIFKGEERNTYLAYLAVCILWGSTYLAIRIGVSEFPPALFAGSRFLTAGLIMFLFSVSKGMKLPKDFSETMKISVVGLFLLLGGNGCVVLAEKNVNSGIASLLVATVPLFMALIELFLPGRPRLNLKGWIGLLLGFGGVAILAFPNSSGSSGSIFGIVLLLIGSFSWAVGSVYSKSFKPSASIIPNIAIQMLAGGIGLIIVGAFSGEFSKLHVTSKGIGAIVYLIIFGSILGYSCYVYILHKWPAAKAGTYAYVNPLVAVFLGGIVLSEPLSVWVVMSTVVILGGVILVQTSKSKIQ
ncbi:EamA family transporter [Candidatus Clostridium stratigraminis]|uniref:EamA family transporter n=1 Tax=Candidatus Clostridium stratigraminis TaxID=3381661 RepID=A0ABW8SZ80_9CLOT